MSDQVELGVDGPGTDVATREDAPPAPTQAGEVSDLVKLALEQGVAVEVLERLVALQERVTDRDATTQLFQALAAFQDECPPIEKSRDADIVTKKGTRYGYKYASLDDIAKAIRPHLRAHGLSYTWESDVEGQQLRCTCIVRHVAGASVTAAFSCPVDNPSAMSPQQKVGAALTYAKRQSLVEALGLTVADVDNDGAGGIPPEPISDEQLANLTALFDEVKQDVDERRFLEFFAIEQLEDMPVGRYEQAIKMLEREEKVIVHTHDELGDPITHGSQAWWALRLGLPTCSQFHRIVTAKKRQYAAAASGYIAELLAEDLLGEPIDWGATDWMMRGREMEAEARQWYELEHATDVERVGFITNDDVDEGGSPDGLVGDDGGLEIKCYAVKHHMECLLGFQPIAAPTQVQGYLRLTGRKWWDTLAYNPVLPPVLVRTERDEKMIAALDEHLPTFKTALAHARKRLDAILEAGVGGTLEVLLEASVEAA